MVTSSSSDSDSGLSDSSTASSTTTDDGAFQGFRSLRDDTPLMPIRQRSNCKGASKVRSTFLDDKNKRRRLRDTSNYPVNTVEQMEELEEKFFKSRRIKFVPSLPSSQGRDFHEILEFYLHQVFGQELLLDLANQRMPRKRKNTKHELVFLARFKMLKAGLYAAAKNDAATQIGITVTRQQFEEGLTRVLANNSLAGEPSKEPPQLTDDAGPRAGPSSAK